MMNVLHRRLCSSRKWADMVDEHLTVWLKDNEIGDDVVEIGPGYGATTRVLIKHCAQLTAVEVDGRLAADLERKYGDRVRIIHASGTDVPLPDTGYSGVVCFTMLHHVPSREKQDRIFAEAFRLLRPGGLFAGVDSQLSFGFRLLHLGDTMVVVDPKTLPGRLERAGFADVKVTAAPGAPMMFRGRKP